MDHLAGLAHVFANLARRVLPICRADIDEAFFLTDDFGPAPLDCGLIDKRTIEQTMNVNMPALALIGDFEAPHSADDGAENFGSAEALEPVLEESDGLS